MDIPDESALRKDGRFRNLWWKPGVCFEILNFNFLKQPDRRASSTKMGLACIGKGNEKSCKYT